MGRMNLEGITLSEISQMEKDKQQMNDLIYIWNLKKKKIHIYREHWWLPQVGKGLKGGQNGLRKSKGTNFELKISREDVMYSIVTVINNSILHI